MKTTDERTSPSAPLGEKVKQPVQPQKTVEQWVATGTPGYVRSTVNGAIKPTSLAEQPQPTAALNPGWKEIAPAEDGWYVIGTKSKQCDGMWIGHYRDGKWQVARGLFDRTYAAIIGRESQCLIVWLRPATAEQIGDFAELGGPT